MLQPKIYRNFGWRKSERELALGLIAESPRDFPTDGSAFEKLVRSQHFALPTRLMDLTSNPLVALYFSCSSFEAAGQVIVFEADPLRIKYFNSDAVSCKANLAFLSDSERTILLERCMIVASSSVYPDFPKKKSYRPGDYPYFDLLRVFNTEDPMGRLLHFIKEEKPYFEPRIEPQDLLSSVIAIPKKSNPRILAQSGDFVVFGLIDSITEEKGDGFSVYRIGIPAEHKADLLTDLKAVGITESTVFPELDKIAAGLSSRFARDDH